MEGWGGYRSSNYGLDVSRGRIEGHEPQYKFGHNDVVGTSDEDVWSVGGLYPYPTTELTMTVSSDDSNDASGGSGAVTVEIFYLDGNYIEQSIIKTLTGLTGVTVSTDIFRPHRMIIRSDGSPGTSGNVGKIYLGTGSLTLGVPATIYAQIDEGKGQTLMSVYTIPANKTGYVWGWLVSPVGQQSTANSVHVRPFGEVFQIKDEAHAFQDVVRIDYRTPRPVTAKSDITIRSRFGAGSGAMGSYLDVELVDD